VRHPILNTLPGTGEAQLFSLDQEIDQLSRNLSLERRKANVVRDISLIRDLQDLERSVALRSTAPAKASRTRR
jgi:hypothetical protein